MKTTTIAGRGGRKAVRAPRGRLNADLIDFEHTWSALAAAFREIHTQNASALSFEELYRNGYRIVLKKKGDLLYEQVSQFEQDWLSQDVYNKMLQLLSPALVSGAVAGSGAATAIERRTAGEKLLKGVNKAFEEHQICMAMITDVLMYMDRCYCTDARKPSIYTVGLSLFRQNILASSLSTAQAGTLLDLVIQIVLEQVAMERGGEVIDRNMIKATCTYVLEGLFLTSAENEGEELYRVFFEPEFLKASTTFYRQESELFLRESDAGTYCRHARRRISEEEERCLSTLSESTTSKIIKVVEDELIRHKIKELIEMENSGVRFMIDNERLEELGLVYDLNSRVDPKKAELTRALQKRIVEMGQEVNNSASAAATAPSLPAADGEDKAKAPAEKGASNQTTAAIKWVEDVLLLKDKFDNIWTTSFNSDQGLQTALTRSFTEFINAYPRSSEYISLFIDENMKKGLKGKTENEVDAVLDKAIVLLRYIQDKDMFERYYKKHLCKRLLMQKSISQDVEKQMIGRMKMELGNNFTTKLEAMFKDMALSEELSRDYAKYLSRRDDSTLRKLELSISILTSMTWPLETFGNTGDQEDGTKLKCIYPPEIDAMIKDFERFYTNKHSGRVLTWQANMGSADIKATFPKVPSKEGSKERKHELNVSTYAMVILLLFNDLPDGASLSFEEIQAKTNIPSNDLVRNLQSLAVAPKTRILLKDPMSKDVKPTDRFLFNEGFQSKFFKLKVGVVAAGNKVESDKDREQTEKKNNDTRAYAVDAAVVRIMKQRKEYTHQQLVTETISQLAAQFKPEVNMIKRQIESLIEREYLERIENSNPPAYKYLA